MALGQKLVILPRHKEKGKWFPKIFFLQNIGTRVNNQLTKQTTSTGGPSIAQRKAEVQELVSPIDLLKRESRKV